MGKWADKTCREVGDGQLIKWMYEERVMDEIIKRNWKKIERREDQEKQWDWIGERDLLEERRAKRVS